MKLAKSILLINIFLISQVILAQQYSKNKDSITVITYNIDGSSFNDTRTLENGKYILIINGTFNPATEIINSEFQSTIIVRDPIKNKSKDSILFSKNIKEYQNNYHFDIKDRSQIEVKITRIKTTKSKKYSDSVSETKEETREFNIKFKGYSKMKWQTTIGLAGVFNFNSDTYKTIPNGNGFRIVEDGSQELINPIPLMLFTFMNPEKDYSFGVSGGIGFDTENFSVFLGPSFNIGHNLILTGGLGLHKQKRLDNKYEPGQEVDITIDSADLNTTYYRVNPFVSLTFNLSNNPFSTSPSTNDVEVNEEP